MEERGLLHPNPNPFTKRNPFPEVHREQSEKGEVQGQKA